VSESSPPYFGTIYYMNRRDSISEKEDHRMDAKKVQRLVRSIQESGVLNEVSSAKKKARAYSGASAEKDKTISDTDAGVKGELSRIPGLEKVLSDNERTSGGRQGDIDAIKAKIAALRDPKNPENAEAVRVYKNSLLAKSIDSKTTFADFLKLYSDKKISSAEEALNKEIADIQSGAKKASTLLKKEIETAKSKAGDIKSSGEAKVASLDKIVKDPELSKSAKDYEIGQDAGRKYGKAKKILDNLVSRGLVKVVGDEIVPIEKGAEKFFKLGGSTPLKRLVSKIKKQGIDPDISSEDDINSLVASPIAYVNRMRQSKKAPEKKEGLDDIVASKIRSFYDDFERAASVIDPESGASAKQISAIRRGLNPDLRKEEIEDLIKQKDRKPLPLPESYTLSELNEAFTQAGYDTGKFKTEYLAEQLGFKPLREMSLQGKKYSDMAKMTVSQMKEFINDQVLNGQMDFDDLDDDDKTTLLRTVFKAGSHPEDYFTRVSPRHDLDHTYRTPIGVEFVNTADQIKASERILGSNNRIDPSETLILSSPGDSIDNRVRNIVRSNNKVTTESYAAEELREAFIRAGLDTNKYTLDYLAEQLGFVPLDEYYDESPKDIAAKRTGYAMNQDLPEPKPTADDWKYAIKGRKSEGNASEVLDYERKRRKQAEAEKKTPDGRARNIPLPESYTLSELSEAFAAAGYDTGKYTTEYLAEQLGFVPLIEKPQMVSDVYRGNMDLYDDGVSFGKTDDGQDIRATPSNPGATGKKGEHISYLTHDEASLLKKRGTEHYVNDMRKARIGKYDK
jgi:hypothetical protein